MISAIVFIITALYVLLLKLKDAQNQECLTTQNYFVRYLLFGSILATAIEGFVIWNQKLNIKKGAPSF